MDYIVEFETEAIASLEKLSSVERAYLYFLDNLRRGEKIEGENIEV